MCIKHSKNQMLDFFSQNFLSKSLICLFCLSDLSKSLTVAHLSQATWANSSRSLICLKRPDRFAQGHSFPLSDLNDSLTVTHLSWAIWANHSFYLSKMSKWANVRMSDGRMSNFPALFPLDSLFSIFWSTVSFIDSLLSIFWSTDSFNLLVPYS